MKLKNAFFNFWPLLIIILLSVPTILPLFHSGFYPMHDDQQVARLFELNKAIKDGQFPVRWVRDLGFGYGYPLFVFYPPFVYYLGELFHLIGFSLIDSIKIVIITGMFASGWAMYVLAKNLTSNMGGLLAAVLYMYLPYHAVDLYVRGALAEYWAFVWIPLILWALLKKRIILGGLFLGLLMVTHNLTFIAVMIFLGIFAILFFRVKALIISTVIALLWTFWFWIPALLYKQYTLTDSILTRELADYKLHFVYLRQLWDSAWGYGGSLYGLWDGLSFQIGKIHILLAIITVLLILKKKVDKTGEKKQILKLLMLTFFSIYLMTFHSQWLWNLITPLRYLQFPWRLLIITGLFVSLICAYCINTIKLMRIKIPVFLGLIILVIFINNSYFKPDRYLTVDDNYYLNDYYLKWVVSKSSFEFVPKGVKTVISDVGTTQLAITEDEVPSERVELIAGPADIKILENKTHKLRIRVRGNGISVIRANIFNFPGWSGTIDGQPLRLHDNNDLKLITFFAPPGEHEIVLKFNLWQLSI